MTAAPCRILGSTHEFEETRAVVFLMPVWPAQSSKMPKVAADPPIHNAPKLHGFPISHELVIKGGGIVCSNGFYADISNHHQSNKINHV